ncbi:TIR domain-containing protein [Altererythrobacter sp.]|uniref:TIR domain-containing protein n=1 Tax=Altererythrobacter sp. TaxID=1872480 RepID=UPI003D0203AA
MTDVFVSYARADYGQARRIADSLASAGFSVWIDDDLPAHRAFSTVIEERLNAAKAVLVLWSEDARASRWVPAEADLAFTADKLVQLSLDGVLPPLPFNRVHCETATGWNGSTDAPFWQKITASIVELSGSQGHSLELPAPTPGLAKSAANTEPLLAILPFDNLSSDEELTYFCDGMSEEIQRTVSDGSSLRVVARSSSFQFRGAEKDTAKVASALGATHLLDGSVRRGGARVRISAELVECGSRRAIWGDRFDGDLDDVFALQESIAERVAKALKVALAIESAPGGAQLPPGLYESFLRARGRIAEGDALYDDSAERAIPLLEEVTSAAPDFAPAWELLASASAASLRSGHFEGDYDERRNLVLKSAETALKLDPKRGGAYLALAFLEPWGAYRAREKLLLKALEVSPNDPASLTEMSQFCWSVGRFRDALGLAQKACELNPLMPAARLHVAQMHAYVGDYAGAIALTRQLIRRWPDNPGILISQLNTAGTLGFWEAHDEAAREIDRFDGWIARDMRAAEAYLEALRTKDPEQIEKRISRYEGLLEKTGTLPLNLVVSIAALGQVDRALDLAERASYDYVFDPQGDRPSIYYPGTILGPWSEAMKQKRFAPLCVRLGLSAYWIETGAWPDCVEWTPYNFKEEVRAAHEAARS